MDIPGQITEYRMTGVFSLRLLAQTPTEAARLAYALFSDAGIELAMLSTIEPATGSPSKF
jgi:hypothetical protein